MNWPEPIVVTGVRSFIGLASYYRKFVRNFACIATPLHELTKQDVPFAWGEEEKCSFGMMKMRLAHCTMLAFPLKDAGNFILDTDASGHAIGGILSQIQGGVQHPLAFGSRCLSATERNYCVTRRELLAAWRQYLLGVEVKVRKNHGCLTWLKTMRNPSGQVACWIECLVPFSWIIEHSLA